jgi:hypothetical protein
MNEEDLQPLHADERAKAEHLANLVYRFIHSQTTAEENDELEQWIAEHDANASVFKELTMEDYMEYVRTLSAEGRSNEAMTDITKTMILFFQVRIRKEKNKWLMGAVLIFLLIIITVFIIKR